MGLGRPLGLRVQAKQIFGAAEISFYCFFFGGVILFKYIVLLPFKSLTSFGLGH